MPATRHWQHPATHHDSEILATFYVNWGDQPPCLWQIETDEGFALEDLMWELGCLEFNAIGRVKHGDIPPP